MKQYDSIVHAKDFQKSLCEHFTYLTGNGADPVLSAILKKATSARVFEENLIVSFERGFELHASPAGDGMNYEKWPESFQTYVARHEYLSFGTDQWELCLGNRKSFYFESRLLDKYDKKDILIPVINTFSFQVWLYHPMEKNHAGENLIYHFAPNYGGDIDSPSELSAGQIFLQEMASALDIRV